MKRIAVIILSLTLLITGSLPAQKKADVFLKFSKQDGVTRIVFEADEAFINKIKTTTSSSQIKIEFPEPFILKPQQDLPFELLSSEKSVTINLKEKSEIKSFKLTSPARVVFDIQKKNEIQTEKQLEKAEKNTEKPTEKQIVKQTEQQSATIISRVFVIDAGHGGYDFGITHGNASEKEISLNLAKDLGSVLSKKGKKVFLMRKVDQYISLADRINFINQKIPDIFISFHSSLSRNFVVYSPRTEEQGSQELEDLYGLSSKQKKYLEKSKALSNSIAKVLKDEFKTDIMRREMPIPLLNAAGAPAVLVEFPSPRFTVYDQQMKTRLINSIISGITMYGQ